jgi:osmoprotectant transport system ATP-binding protein
MIKIKNVFKQFSKIPAVRDVSFEVLEGENLIILGTSGCGKTTLLRMINRLIEPDSGSVFINGTNIKDKKPDELRRGIGYVLQNHGLFPHYTVAENIAIVPRLLKWKDADIKKRSDELFSKLNLDDSLKDKYPSALSGGQQQRVGVARSLMVNPPVLLMDEPFGALDNLTRISIREEFRRLDELVKKTIIMVTHDVQEAFEMGDRICLMDKGKVQQIGTPKELLMHPTNDFVRGFFEEQRFQLELKFVLLSDILPDHNVEDNYSVWDKLSQLMINKEISLNGEELSAEFLMGAFADYKKKIYGTR